MAESETQNLDRTYSCTFGCGNHYDYIFTNVHDSTVLFLCVPCMIHLSAEIVGTITDSAEDATPDMTVSATPSGHNVPNIITGDLFAEDD